MSAYTPLRPDPKDINDVIYWVQGEFDQIANAIEVLYAGTPDYAELYYDAAASVDNDANATLSNWTGKGPEAGKCAADPVNGTIKISQAGTYEIHSTLYVDIGVNADAVIEVFDASSTALAGAKSGGQTKGTVEHVNTSITSLSVIVSSAPVTLHLANTSTGTFIVRSGSFWVRRVFP